MKQVRYGIVGLGNMGSQHFNFIKNGEIEGAVLGAVCDIKPDRLEWARNNYEGALPCYENYSEMLHSGNIDAVIIAVPHYLHPVIGMEALDLGIATLSEKPIGVYTKIITEWNEKAKACGVPFGIMYNQRTNPVYRKMREIVKSGELGEMKRAVWIITNWYRSQAYYDSGTWRATWAGEGGGVLINQCPHNLDLWQWICGMPSSVRAFMSFGKYHDIEVEDDVTIYAKYSNGATGLFITTTAEAPGTNRFEISGTKGKIVYDGKLRHWKLGCDERVFNAENKVPFAAPPCEYFEYDLGPSPEHRGILRNFTNRVLYGEELIAPGIEGINGLSISNAAHLSEWTGNAEIELPNDGEAFLQELKKRIKTSRAKPEYSTAPVDISGTYNS